MWLCWSFSYDKHIAVSLLFSLIQNKVIFSFYITIIVTIINLIYNVVKNNVRSSLKFKKHNVTIWLHLLTILWSHFWHEVHNLHWHHCYITKIEKFVRKKYIFFLHLIICFEVLLSPFSSFWRYSHVGHNVTLLSSGFLFIYTTWKLWPAVT